MGDKKFPDGMSFGEGEIRYYDELSRREERWVPVQHERTHTLWKRLIVDHDGKVGENEALFVVRIRINDCVQDTRSIISKALRGNLPYPTHGELTIPVGKKGSITVQRLSQKGKDGVVVWSGNHGNDEKMAKDLYPEAESIQRLGDFVLVTEKDLPPLRQSEAAMPPERTVFVPIQSKTPIHLNPDDPNKPVRLSVTTDRSEPIENRALTSEEQQQGRYIFVANAFKGMRQLTFHVYGQHIPEGFIDGTGAIINIEVIPGAETGYILRTIYEGKAYEAILKTTGDIQGEFPTIAATALTPTWKQVRLPKVIRRDHGDILSAKREQEVHYFREDNDLHVLHSGIMRKEPEKPENEL